MKKVIRVLLIAIVLLLGLCACSGTEAKKRVDYNPYLVLVNKTNELPENWEYIVEIEPVVNSLGEEIWIEHKTYEAFEQLRFELKNYGIQIELDSVYRSVKDQQELWNAWSADPTLGEEYCKKYLAVPGFSEHHTGLAVDIFLIKDGEIIRENEDMIEDKDDFDVIHKIMPKYGFILRYPEGKENVTGYAYEPWHLRYIDNAELAETIMSQDLTLEEYLQQSNQS